jgi:hypothetical protein
MNDLGLSDCKVYSYSDVLLPSLYGNEVSESLKTLILKMHLQICRPVMINKNIILATLKKQLGFEKSIIMKATFQKYQSSIWNIADQYLICN